MQKKISLIIALVLLLSPTTATAGKRSKDSKKTHYEKVLIMKPSHKKQIKKLEKRVAALEQVIFQLIASSTSEDNEEVEDTEESTNKKEQVSDSVAHMYL